MEAGEFNFYYIVENGIVYLTLAERTFPRRAAFEYLSELASAFMTEYGSRIGGFTRPYAAVSFDTTIDKIRAKYLDPNTHNKLSRVNSSLHEIQSVMTQNIQDIILRGEKLEQVEDRSSRMLADSKMFKQNAKYMNLMALWKTYGPIGVIALVVLFVLWYKFSG
jgi:vesicle transport protein SEC22